jgi:hypothetical protein
VSHDRNGRRRWELGRSREMARVLGSGARRPSMVRQRLSLARRDPGHRGAALPSFLTKCSNLIDDFINWRAKYQHILVPSCKSP